MSNLNLYGSIINKKIYSFTTIFKKKVKDGYKFPSNFGPSKPYSFSFIIVFRGPKNGESPIKSDLMEFHKSDLNSYLVI